MWRAHSEMQVLHKAHNHRDIQEVVILNLNDRDAILRRSPLFELQVKNQVTHQYHKQIDQ